MSDKIAEIRKRHEQSEKNYIELESTWKAQIHDDRAFLLAEVDRQRAEIERLRAELDVELFNRSLVKRALEGKP